MSRGPVSARRIRREVVPAALGSLEADPAQHGHQQRAGGARVHAHETRQGGEVGIGDRADQVAVVLHPHPVAGLGGEGVGAALLHRLQAVLELLQGEGPSEMQQLPGDFSAVGAATDRSLIFTLLKLTSQRSASLRSAPLRSIGYS